MWIEAAGMFIYAILFGIFAVNVWDLRRARRRLRPTVPLPSLSVLIPARNEASNLRRLLPDLLTQDYPSFDVIVFDDDSTDGTAELLRSQIDTRIVAIHGTGPPAGWVGKVHALYEATRIAQGEIYLFLDADASLLHPRVLTRLVSDYLQRPEPAVLTGLSRLSGGGQLLVSLVPHAVLTSLPWPLLRILAVPGAGAVNGQCWLIRRELYHTHEPHAAFPGEVLEDVRIGGYLRGRGVVPYLADVTDDLQVNMYPSMAEAWRGFRKNAYLLMTGRPLPFVVLSAGFAVLYLLLPLTVPSLLLALYVLKAMTDRVSRTPLWVTLLAPVSFLLAVILQWDSALHHWMGRVRWKGRLV